MQENRISIREWQKRYKAGNFNSKARSVQCEAGWYDWFCRDEALAGRLKKLAPVIMGITEPFILDNYYLWLKNNCPMVGPLYDDVRFEPLEGERDGKYFLVALNSPHESQKWALITERFGFDKPEYECDDVRNMVKWINRLGYELSNGITPDFIEERRKGKFYIAYGSNLNLEQMKHRCPTAEVVGKTMLENYRLRFRGKFTSTFATVEPAEGRSVPVLVWKLKAEDETQLDRYEGSPSQYRKETLSVEVNGEIVDAMIYIMNERFPYRQPGESYYQVILDGYKELGFDPRILDAYLSENLEDMPSEEPAMKPVEEPTKDTTIPATATKKLLTPTIREQFMAVRASGETNMIDTRMVQYIANREGYYELVAYLEEHRKEYLRFVIFGEES